MYMYFVSVSVSVSVSVCVCVCVCLCLCLCVRVLQVFTRKFPYEELSLDFPEILERVKNGIYTHLATCLQNVASTHKYTRKKNAKTKLGDSGKGQERYIHVFM